MILEDSSLSSEEDGDDDFKIAVGMIFNEDFLRPMRGSQFGSMHLNREKVEGHANTMRDKCEPFDEVYYHGCPGAVLP